MVCDDDPSEDEQIRESPILIIEVQRRSASWQSSYYFLGDEVVLESVNASLPVEAIYERVKNDDVLAWLEQQQAEGA
ncbi:hypothetical protein [Thiothrix lacustris]|uniref:hypothetical protein n=1 Tax=Thiothrix lacustris TaxID=525917 RepID=UPI0027E585F7|nr:hypothetical protein [Thiothrix lacustris]WMP16999.1 hypothetical protein RCS87_16705 [Thiothrix lacustris]